MIYKVPILIMVLILGGSLIHKYTMGKHHTYVPLFKVKECFLFSNHPDKRPDGIVTMVGDLEYTVLWSREAERRYPGPKVGATVPIKWMDIYASHTTCPSGWINQGRK